MQRLQLYLKQPPADYYQIEIPESPAAKKCVGCSHIIVIKRNFTAVTSMSLPYSFPLLRKKGGWGEEVGYLKCICTKRTYQPVKHCKSLSVERIRAY